MPHILARQGQDIYVFGDIHGDLGALVACLVDCAWVVDLNGNWTGGIR